jgi:hypothetical protein
MSKICFDKVLLIGLIIILAAFILYYWYDMANEIAELKNSPDIEYVQMSCPKVTCPNSNSNQSPDSNSSLYNHSNDASPIIRKEKENLQPEQPHVRPEMNQQRPNIRPEIGSIPFTQQISQMPQMPPIPPIPPMTYPSPIPFGYIDNDNEHDRRMVGQLHKQGTIAQDDPYKVLPLYRTRHRGDFFRYYTEYKSGGQMFKMNILKNNRDTMRELYDDDIIKLKFPLDGEYKVKDHIF